MKRHTNKLKMILFIFFTIVIFWRANLFLQPIWTSFNNYDTIHGFYKEPENTIETIFLGASIVVMGIAPMEMYENFGISCYNLGTEQQPMLCSYYWLEEAFRFHSETLKTVVLDVSMLRRVPQKAFYHKAIDDMQLSRVKYNAIKDQEEDWNKRINYIFPAFNYHTRWSGLERIDFEKNGYIPNVSSRGYLFSVEKNSNADDRISISKYVVDENAELTELNEEALQYLERMVGFCKEKGIQLILIKTPTLDQWTSSDHNAVQQIAEINDLKFIDFSFEPYIGELQYVCATDCIDSAHMNYYGAKKLSKWLGEYLVNECGATDVRNNKQYAFMENELEEYYRYIEMAELEGIADPCEYIAALKERKDYTIFISARDDAANVLTDEQREQFAALGLMELSEISFRDAYLGVIDDGKVMCDKTYRKEEKDSEEEDPGEEEKGTPFTYEGILSSGKKYSLVSGGFETGMISSCIINHEEYSRNGRGLNIVVYDNKKENVLDSVVFDTYTAPTREMPNVGKSLAIAREQGLEYSELTARQQALYRYNRRCDNAKEFVYMRKDRGGESLMDYLAAFKEKEEWYLILSVQDDAATNLDEMSREDLKGIGLQELSNLRLGDSYLAVLNDGEVIVEKRSSGKDLIEIKGYGYRLVSGGQKSGGTSSIEINGAKYVPDKSGIQLVIYDKLLGEAIENITFETCANQVVDE